MDNWTVDMRELVREIQGASGVRLRQLWAEYFGKVPARKLRPELMRPVLIYRVQERELGGMAKPTKEALKATLRALEPGRRHQEEARNRYKAGTRIVRGWKGETHEVLITEHGYVHQGETYASLSPIARKITGRNGPGPSSSVPGGRRSEWPPGTEALCRVYAQVF